MKSNLIYKFDRQKTLKARYMIRNNKSSQEHKRHDKRYIDQRD